MEGAKSTQIDFETINRPPLLVVRYRLMLKNTYRRYCVHLNLQSFTMTLVPGIVSSDKARWKAIKITRNTKIYDKAPYAFRYSKFFYCCCENFRVEWNEIEWYGASRSGRLESLSKVPTHLRRSNCFQSNVFFMTYNVPEIILVKYDL